MELYLRNEGRRNEWPVRYSRDTQARVREGTDKADETLDLR